MNHQLNIAQNLVRLIIADCQEEFAYIHSDEAEAEMEALASVKVKAEKAEAAIAAALDERERLREFVEGIAGGSCCESPGCSIDDPMCDTMMARAMLEGKEDT